MTLWEMSGGYADSAEAIRRRIAELRAAAKGQADTEIGRASCRERV